MASVAVALNTIWSMHFIGMEAVYLTTVAKKQIVPINFEVKLTVLSGIVPILFTTIGFHILANRSVDERTTFDRSARISLLKSTFLIASAIGCMHYLGMESEVGSFTRTYSAPVVAASCVIALIS